MNIFEYLKQDEERLTNLLKNLHENFGTIEVDKVFDQITGATEGLIGHLQMEENLLLANISKPRSLLEPIQQFLKDKKHILEEIGLLSQVHVDEPDFKGTLARLLKAIEAHSNVSGRLFQAIAEHAPDSELTGINKQLEDEIFKSTRFSQMQRQTPSG